MLPEYLHNVSFSNEVPSGAQFLSWITFQDFLLLNLDVLTNSRVPDLFLLKFLDNSHPLLNTEPSLFFPSFFPASLTFNTLRVKCINQAPCQENK